LYQINYYKTKLFKQKIPKQPVDDSQYIIQYISILIPH